MKKRCCIGILYCRCAYNTLNAMMEKNTSFRFTARKNFCHDLKLYVYFVFCNDDERRYIYILYIWFISIKRNQCFVI